MTPEEIRAVIEAAVENSAGMNYLQVVFLIAGTALASFLGAYLKEKAKSTVTKKDVEQVTRKVEEIKNELERQDQIAIKKYELQYMACLNMLGIIDSHLSHVMSLDNEGKQIEVDRQYVTPEKARKCHNDLLLTVDNTEIVDLFLRMMVGKCDNIMADLDTIRQLVRKELGFGSEIHSDGDYTWLAVIHSKKNG